MTDEHIITEEELRGMVICQQRICHSIRKRTLSAELQKERERIIKSFESIYRFRNALMDEVSSRPDPLALLEAWRKWMYDHNDIHRSGVIIWMGEQQIIKQLRTNPSAVRERGIKEGWWHD